LLFFRIHFNGKNSKDYVAKILKISRASVYNYLNEIKGYLPEWIWELSTRQARIVVDYMNDHNNIYNT
jgi:predicted transcriptional regulator